MVFLALWTSWLLLARVPVYVASREARLEVAQDAYRIEARVDGQVSRVATEVGRRVTAGDVLFELDDEVERRRLEEELARSRGLRRQLATTKAEVEGRLAALDETRRSWSAEQAEGRAELASAHAAAKLATAEAERGERLLAEGLMPSSEVERLRSVAEQRHQDVQVASLALERLRSRAAAEEQERKADLALARREIDRLEGELAASAEIVRRLREEVARRTVRAPADGSVAELGVRRAGDRVEAGEHLATLIPDVELLAVAKFDPAQALGRITAGQPAEIRLEGFPWTEFGTLQARVRQVAGEPRDGGVRVELAVEDGAAVPVPLTHGLPGSVLVRVERTSPISLVLRAVGQRAGDGGTEATVDER